MPTIPNPRNPNPDLHSNRTQPHPNPPNKNPHRTQNRPPNRHPPPETISPIAPQISARRRLGCLRRRVDEHSHLHPALATIVSAYEVIPLGLGECDEVLPTAPVPVRSVDRAVVVAGPVHLVDIVHILLIPKSCKGEKRKKTRVLQSFRSVRNEKALKPRKSFFFPWI